MTLDGTVLVDGVSYGERLPRGRHRIPPEVVRANQRARLFGAAAAVMGERGYAALSVGDLIERAHVSRATFYRLFDDKQACVLAAECWSVERLVAVIAEACAREREWPQGVVAGVDAALSFAARSAGETRLVLASSQSPTEPGLAGGAFAADQRLAALLRDGSKRWPGARRPEDIVERAAVGAAMSIVGSCLVSDDLEDLTELRPALVQLILAPYVGEAEARSLAGSAPPVTLSV